MDHELKPPNLKILHIREEYGEDDIDKSYGIDNQLV
jgi:hypothetical protein